LTLLFHVQIYNNNKGLDISICFKTFNEFVHSLSVIQYFFIRVEWTKMRLECLLLYMDPSQLGNLKNISIRGKLQENIQFYQVLAC
jgi:hypothetical protein